MKSEDWLLLIVVVVLYSIYFSVPYECKIPKEPEVIVRDTVEVVEVVEHELLATYYNACESQCNADPLVTADMSKINKEKLVNLDIRWCAVSRDMLEYYPYGTVIHVQSENETLNGYWEVHDTMNKRYTGRIDFLFPEGENFDFDRPMTVKVTKVIN